MNLQKTMLMCWSFVWGLTVHSIPHIELTQGMSYIIYGKESPLNMVNTIWYKVPLYVFGVWLAGCVIIPLFAFLIGLFVGRDER